MESERGRLGDIEEMECASRCDGKIKITQFFAISQGVF
jgi:hypothetical protein